MGNSGAVVHLSRLHAGEVAERSDAGEGFLLFGVLDCGDTLSHPSPASEGFA
jgi:hypothetical protein